MFTPDWDDRFWSKVRIGDGCWEWTRATNAPGYGSLQVFGRWHAAHRLSWEMSNGPIPPGAFVCHHCDNRRCVRPGHLFLGTPAQNSADAARKGRAFKKPMPGESNPRARLNEHAVREIRRRASQGESTASLCARFGLSRTSVRYIATRRSWRHVP